jgi:hypothetical protein
MAVEDASGLLVAAHVESASPHEVKLVKATLKTCFLLRLPKKLIGNRVYDSDSLGEFLARLGIEIIGPEKTNQRAR